MGGISANEDVNMADEYSVVDESDDERTARDSPSQAAKTTGVFPLLHGLKQGNEMLRSSQIRDTVYASSRIGEAWLSLLLSKLLFGQTFQLRRRNKDTSNLFCE